MKTRLRDMADSGRIPHSLMLAGIPGIGKMRLARAFAQYLACRNHVNGDSCGVCPECLQAQSLNFPDISYVYPIIKRSKPKKQISEDYIDEWRKYLTDNSYMPMTEWLDAMDAGNSQPKIYVEESAEILRRLSLSSYSARYAVTIIWQPEKLTPEASNKLLKIIEEPFADTIFLMVSNEPDAILPTIRSRTQTIYVRPLESDEIASTLQRERGADPASALNAARLAQGSYLEALTALRNDGETVAFRDLFQEMMRMCYSRNMVRLKEISEKIAAMGREGSRRFLTYVATMLRENFIYNMRQPQLNLMTADEEAFSSRFSPFVNSRNIEAMAKTVADAVADIERNANCKIVCFDMVLQITAVIRK